jgi:hypothetical protein
MGEVAVICFHRLFAVGTCIKDATSVSTSQSNHWIVIVKFDCHQVAVKRGLSTSTIYFNLALLNVKHSISFKTTSNENVQSAAILYFTEH